MAHNWKSAPVRCYPEKGAEEPPAGEIGPQGRSEPPAKETGAARGEET